MTEKFRFFDAVEVNGVYDREYNADEFTDYFRSLVTTGVMKGHDDDLEPYSNGDSMEVRVGPGIAFIEGKYYQNEGSLGLTVDTETVGLSRIDRIVIRLDSNPEARYVKAFIKKGTASTNPKAPTLTRNDTVYEISLAQVRVQGGVSYISYDAIIDERGDDRFCPWVGSKILPNFDEGSLNYLMDDLYSHTNNSTMHIPYTVASGTANNYTALISGVKSYVEGMAFSLKINIQNTGSSTININGLGAKAIVDSKGLAVKSGTLVSGGIYTVRYTGSNFILQGSGGGEYGTATASDVLSGKTIGTDNGLVTGTIVNRSGTTQTGTRRAQGTGYVDVSLPQGYYDGATNTRVRLSDSNFSAANIKSGVSMFGLVGTNSAQFGYQQVAITLPEKDSNVSVDIYSTVNFGFNVKYYAYMLGPISTGARYTASVFILFPSTTGSSAYAANMATRDGNQIIRAYLADSNNNTSYASGTRVYIYGSLRSYYGIDAQTIPMDIFAWG